MEFKCICQHCWVLHMCAVLKQIFQSTLLVPPTTQMFKKRRRTATKLMSASGKGALMGGMRSDILNLLAIVGILVRKGSLCSA